MRMFKFYDSIDNSLMKKRQFVRNIIRQSALSSEISELSTALLDSGGKIFQWTTVSRSVITARNRHNAIVDVDADRYIECLGIAIDMVWVEWFV